MPMDMAAKPEAGVSAWDLELDDELEPEPLDEDPAFTKPKPSNPKPFGFPSPPLWYILNRRNLHRLIIFFQ